MKFIDYEEYRTVSESAIVSDASNNVRIVGSKCPAIIFAVIVQQVFLVEFYF